MINVGKWGETFNVSEWFEKHGPHAPDQAVREALLICWINLKNKDVDSLEKDFKRLVERSLANFKEDLQIYGLEEDG
jgi:hypothetical protein